MRNPRLVKMIPAAILVLFAYLPALVYGYPLQLKEISNNEIQCVSIDVCGNYAFCPSSDANVRIIDISQPASPILVGNIEYQYVASTAVSGNIACLDHNSSLSFWDISNITVPVFLSEISLNSGRCDDIKIVGNYVLASVMYAVKAIDFSDPLHPFEAGYVDTPGFAARLAIRGNLALVDDLHDFVIVDITDPTNMQVLSAIMDPLTCVDVDFYGDYAIYTAYAEAYNFIVVDIHDPRNPFKASQIHIPGLLTYLRVIGNFAFVCLDLGGGITIVDISNPLAPILVPQDSVNLCTQLDVAGNNIITAGFGPVKIMALSPSCTNIAGDANGDGHFNGLDVVYDVNFLKGIGYPVCPTYCDGYTSPVYREADANGNCQFNGIDITYGINFLKGGPPLPEICPDCPE
jgi:hypothetical protein